MDQKRIYLSAGIAGILVLIVYAIFISIGPWRERGYTSTYYSQQASAFLHGQIALETKPDPALLALPNPYDHKARKTVPVLGDASLYEGKYYLYFGPLPSLLLAPVSFFTQLRPGDQVFVYIFLIGLFLIQSLFLIEILRRYFTGEPAWLVAGGILLLGLSGPFARMLAHPFIHEAAISGGQFFSTAGLYLVFLALHERPINNRKLLWAGVLWSFAISTRITQLIPIAVMALITWLFIWNESRKVKLGRRFLAATFALATPLLICGVLLAWYNWVRFDSIFEFGLYYQLAAFNLQANYSILFSRVYIIQNIYNYFFNPFKINGTFPYVFPLSGSETPIALSPELPNLYAVEGKFPGLFNSTPFLMFVIIPLCISVANAFRHIRNKTLKTDFYDPFNWTVLTLAGSFIAGSIPTLLIFYVGFRYETEFITGLLMLAILGLCQAYSMITKPAVKKVFVAMGVVFVLFSIIANVTLAFTGLRG